MCHKTAGRLLGLGEVAGFEMYILISTGDTGTACWDTSMSKVLMKDLLQLLSSGQAAAASLH